MAKISLILLPMLFFPGLPAKAGALKDDPKWFECSRDSDCMITSGICSAPTSINRSHETEAKKYYWLRGTADSCAGGPKTAKASLVSRCQAGKCSVVEKAKAND